MQVFFSIFYFFPNLVHNESLYYCNCCMLQQISYLGKFWFVRYGPKWSWPIRFRDFSINCRTRMAVSHEEINGIKWFLVYPSDSFLRNDSLGFSDFWQNGRSVEYWKTDRAVFSGKIHFWSRFGKKTQNGPKIRFFGFFEKFCHVSFSWK